MNLDLTYLGQDALGDAPDWSAGGRVHNWRRYVGENTRALWASFTREQRAALIADADEFAGREHWD